MIELKKITKRYGKNENEVFALKDVSLRIDKGEFVAIMGASGSGKSTLLHIIGAMDRATEGEYLLDGVNVSSYSEKQLCRIRKEKVTFVFQNFALMDKYSAYENIELPLLHTKKSRAERKKLIREAAGKLKVEDQLNKKPKQMTFWFLGKAITSLIFSVPAKNIIILSKPNANPPCGGAPNLSACNKNPNDSQALSSVNPNALSILSWMAES